MLFSLHNHPHPTTPPVKNQTAVIASCADAEYKWSEQDLVVSYAPQLLGQISSLLGYKSKSDRLVSD